MKMTASLLQSYDWFKKCPPSYKSAARQQIVDALYKKPFNNTAVERGQKFEDSIDINFPPEEIAFIKHSLEQPWMTALNLQCKVGTFTFRGRMDYQKKTPAHWPTELVTENPSIKNWFENKSPLIADLKSTMKFSKSGYTDKRQHVIYGLAENCPNFLYIVAVFDDDKGIVPSRYEFIPIVMNLEAEREELVKAVDEFIDWLVNEGLWNTFVNVYNA